MYNTYTDTTYEEVLLSILSDLNLPIIMDADIGHRQPQFTMINGAMAKVSSQMVRGIFYSKEDNCEWRKT